MPFSPATARPIFDPSTPRSGSDERKKVVEYGDSSVQLEFPASMSNDEIAAVLRRDKSKIEAAVSSKRSAPKALSRRQSAPADAAPPDNDGVVDYLDYFGSRR